MRQKSVSAAGWFLEKFSEFIRHIPSARPGPYFHVSDPLKDRKETDAVFRGEKHGYMRLGGHPDITRVEKWLCRFEGGAAFRLRADGMSAVAPLIHAVGETRGHTIVRVLPLYGGTYMFTEILRRAYGFRFVDVYADDPEFLRNFTAALEAGPSAVFFSVSGNPTLTVPDVEGMVLRCHAHPLRPVLICDNTFLFGLFHPFEWGIDAVCASGTKYLAGESAYLLGHCGVSEEFLERDPEFWRSVNEWANCGGTPGSFEAWLTGQFCTFDVEDRIAVHSKNAIAVARFLRKYPHISRVNYPGLPDNYYHTRACRYLHVSFEEDMAGMGKFGGMISFYLNAHEKAEELLYYLNANTHFGNKASLGGPDDIISSPYFLTHRSIPEDVKKRCLITPNLLRLSVGRVRDSQETIEALKRSLDAVFGN